MDASSEFKALIGDKILFRTCDGEFEGIVKDIRFKTKQVILRNVYDLLQNICVGDSTFFFYQFLTYSTINKFRNPEIGKSELILDSKVKFSKNSYNTTVSCKETSSKQTSNRLVAKKDPNYGEFVLKSPPNLQHTLPGDSIIIDSIDLEFNSAANHISRQSVIGVSFQGYEISRIGQLCWICIATEYCVFLFDIQELGKNAFDHGLRNIFQSQNIVKVIHDCRSPSDCLYHIFSTTLSNVFDTQAADFVCKQTTESKSDFVNVISINKCLENYLQVPKEFLYVSKKIEECDYFSKRPLNNECRNILIKDTLYLIMLRKKLKKLMLNSAYEASDFYLEVIADSRKLSSEPSIIPPALLEQGVEIAVLRKDYLKPSVTITASDSKHSSKKNGRCETKLVERDICKNVASNFDCCPFSISNDKQGSKSKHPLNTLIPQTPETLANDVKLKCSVVSKVFSRSKIHDNEKFRNSDSKMTSFKKDQDEVLGLLNHSASKTAFPTANLQKNVTNKFLVSATGTEASACSKLGLQTESNDKNKNSYNVRRNSISDYSDTWDKLRSACGASNNSKMCARKSNIKFVPSGMNC